MNRFFAAFVLALGACAAPATDDDVLLDTGLEGPLDAVPADLAADGFTTTGPTVRAGGEAEVWAVVNQWDDRDTTAARAAGIAWSANSGLTWEEKFDRWVGSFELVPRASGSGLTLRITTPFGTRAFDAPTLECAEVAMFLRATFASWYGLPFFLEGWDAASRQPLYAGHFGFVDRNGARFANFPRFRTSYLDHTASYRAGAAWPSDTRLRGMRLGTDDTVGFLSTGGTTVGAGAYFDELFLNKRVGYFMRLLLLYFGSANLSDGANTFHVDAEAATTGDLLIHRWQRRGIGHVLPIIRRNELGEGRFELAVASGSMPRRQPLYEDPTFARSEFTSEDAGGLGSASDGSPYATLGGGVRRWRTAVLTSGRWRNVVRSADRDAYIADSDTAAISARPARFEELLAALSPEERRDGALARIEAARAHLAMYPASCSARERREDAFADLYAVMETSFGDDRTDVDRRYRTLSDRVLGELVYDRSRTCCWNSSTAAMEDIVMLYAENEQAQATARGECVEPTVFRAEAADRTAGGDGYGRWRAYAASIGRAADWRTWSEDEPCAQRTLTGDTTSGRGATAAACTVTPPPAAGCDAEGAGGSISTARALPTGVTSGRICAGDEDYFRVTGAGSHTVTVRFTHSSGDLDVQVVDSSGRELASSAGTTNSERVTFTGTGYVRVYGYSNAANTYTIE